MALARQMRDAGREPLIINADASQVYADIPILSAAPSPTDLAEIPHALVGHIDGADACNAARWAEEARAAIEQAQEAGAVPIIVGGTGLYLRTMLDGIAPIPAIPADVRTRVRAMPVGDAYAALMEHDAVRAAMLDPGDSTRVQRSLEVVLATGRSLLSWQGDRAGGVSDMVRLVPMVLLPPRDWLASRCAARIDAMVGAGALAEAQRLLTRALDPALPVMRAIGVSEFASHARGEISLDDAKERAFIATRQFAKRQYTWFRNQSPAEWPRVDEELNDDNVIYFATLLRQLALTE